jgi:hypothetical protein
MGRVARENDHGAGRVGFQLTRVEFIAQSDIKDAGNHGVNTILWVHVRHQLLAVGHSNPDCEGRAPRADPRRRPTGRLVGTPGTVSNRHLRTRWLENLPPGLVRLDFALLSARYGTCFLRHTKLLRAHYVKHDHHVKHDHRLSKHGCRDCTRPATLTIGRVFAI